MPYDPNYDALAGMKTPGGYPVPPLVTENEITDGESSDGNVKSYRVEDIVSIVEEHSNGTVAPVGGAAVGIPGVAYVLSTGDDSTAEIGILNKPYLTAQAAWDAGARGIYLGPGSHEILYERGTGPPVVASITGTLQSALAFQYRGTPGDPATNISESGQNGNTPPPLIIYSDGTLYFSNIAIYGGNGGAGGPGSPGEGETGGGMGGDGGRGTYAPGLTLWRCRVGTLTGASGLPGSAGVGGNGNGNGDGMPGNQGPVDSAIETLNLRFCDINTMDASGWAITNQGSSLVGGQFYT
jgi:hypothetical protein